MPETSGESGMPETSGASGTASEYTVSKGDTLSDIAREHGMNARDLANWNDIRNPDQIYEGQRLRMTAP